MKKLLLLIVSAILLSSCTHTITITELYKQDNIDFNKIKEAKITFAGTKNISLREFKKTFNDEYSDTTKLDKYIYNSFVNLFALNMPKAQILLADRKIPAELFGEVSFKTANINNVKNYFENCKSDYLLIIKNIDIANMYVSYSTGKSFSSIEYCLIKLEFEYWDVLNQKKIITATAPGMCAVGLFNYLETLNGAIDDAVKNATTYISENGTAQFVK